MDIIRWETVTVRSGGKRPKEHTYTVVLNITQNTALVSSKSEKNKMHCISGGTCDCIAGSFGGNCAHKRAVAQYWMDQRTLETARAS